MFKGKTLEFLSSILINLFILSLKFVGNFLKYVPKIIRIPDATTSVKVSSPSFILRVWNIFSKIAISDNDHSSFRWTVMIWNSKIRIGIDNGNFWDEKLIFMTLTDKKWLKISETVSKIISSQVFKNLRSTEWLYWIFSYSKHITGN